MGIRGRVVTHGKGTRSFTLGQFLVVFVLVVAIGLIAMPAERSQVSLNPSQQDVRSVIDHRYQAAEKRQMYLRQVRASRHRRITPRPGARFGAWQGRVGLWLPWARTSLGSHRAGTEPGEAAGRPLPRQVRLADAVTRWVRRADRLDVELNGRPVDR